MRTFKARRKRNYYKNTNAWLNAVYRYNKELIDREFTGGLKGPRASFKELIRQYVKEGMDAQDSLNTIARSTMFTSVEERLRNNALTALKSKKSSYKEFLNLNRGEKGRFEQFDINKLKWIKEEHLYVYSDRIVIKFDNSPLDIIVTSVSKYNAEHKTDILKLRDDIY